MSEALTKIKRDRVRGNFSLRTSASEVIRAWRERSGLKLKLWNDVAAIRKWRDRR